MAAGCRQAFKQKLGKWRHPSSQRTLMCGESEVDERGFLSTLRWPSKTRPHGWWTTTKARLGPGREEQMPRRWKTLNHHHPQVHEERIWWGGFYNETEWASRGNSVGKAALFKVPQGSATEVLPVRFLVAAYEQGKNPSAPSVVVWGEMHEHRNKCNDRERRRKSSNLSKYKWTKSN